MAAMRCCALAGLLRFAAGEDAVALLQQSVAPHADTGFGVERFIADHKAMIMRAPEMARDMVDGAAAEQVLSTVAQSKKVTETFRKTMLKGWRAFYEKSHRSTDSDPHELMQHAKMALIETGAMQQMRLMAAATANATKTAKRAVPLDSMLVGFRTSVAPWNNILKMFKMPLIKASFTIFTNFFGPEGNAARLCIGASTAVDSEYGRHARSEFSGINVFIGPAKWDNVPGWSFGTSGGYDNVQIMDVADFGWKWTLAREPETVCFFYDLCIATDEELHANMLQTESEVGTAAGLGQIPKINLAERHGSTWLEHIWCSPDWFNTPLVIPEDATVMKEMGGEQGGQPYFKDQEEWDPDSEAV